MRRTHTQIFICSMISPNYKSEDCLLVNIPPCHNFLDGISMLFLRHRQSSMWWNRINIWFVVLAYALFDGRGFNKSWLA